MMKNGIMVAGNVVVDLLKKIDIYPGSCNLTTIQKVDISMGGSVNNCGIDLARLDPSLPLYAVGNVGDDDYGRMVRDTLSRFPNYDLSGLRVGGSTSFTDVMYDSERATRAFFQFRGCNASFDIDNFDFDRQKPSILHIAYLLLLDALDKADPTYKTRMARLLDLAQQHGIKTSIDVVSEESDRYQSVVAPCLKYVDYCIINELEASRITGIPAYDENGQLLEDNMPAICRALRDLGVRDWIVIHARPASFGLDTDGTFLRVSAIDLPRSLIKGTTGAGDAFCSGVLYGAYREVGLCEAMKIGTQVATVSLLMPGASDSILPFDEMQAFCAQYPDPEVSVIRS